MIFGNLSHAEYRRQSERQRLYCESKCFSSKLYTLNSKLIQDTLQEMIAQGYIQKQHHPSAPLWIYNYTPLAQYERVWNAVTLQCRGLILDEDYRVVARPFPKFFNLGEMENQYIPDEPFEVYEKMDGSLGILYWLDDTPHIATRGSFTSDQAMFAERLLHERYAASIPKLDRSKTYLFEIIYPDNRIVVDYGDTKDIVLLAVIDTATGVDVELEDIGFPIVKRYDGIQDIYTLQALEQENREGFVIKFKSGLRYKVKFEEYVRIHRIVTQVSSISIWEYLKTGQSFEEILEKVPDEFYDWVRKTQNHLLEKYNTIEAQCQADFKVLDTRKDTAMYFLSCTYPAVLFAMLDKKPYDPIIWKMLRPEYERPFKGSEKLEVRRQK